MKAHADGKYRLYGLLNILLFFRTIGAKKSVFSIFVCKDSDLAVMGLGTPCNLIGAFIEIAAEGSDDAAMAGDQDIFIILSFDFL